MQYLTAGESHGPALMAILEGVPAGLQLSREDIDRETARRMTGYGRGGRMKIETDRVQICAGLRGGVTIGSPIGFYLENRDYAHWTRVMDPFDGDVTAKALSAVRPGHADYAGCVKYGLTDARNILERASARQTAMRVAVGAVCKRYLAELGIRVGSHVIAVGGEYAAEETFSAQQLIDRADADPVRCMDAAASVRMRAAIDRAKEAGDTVGGKFRLVISGVPAGFGAHTEYFRKLDYRLGGQLMSLQSVKSVEIGLGAACADRPGSGVHDAMYLDDGRVGRRTNNAGGIEGGISNGEDIVITCAVKPIPTLMAGLDTVDLSTMKEARSQPERSDVCAVPAAAVVGEAIAAYVLADVVSETLGGDYMDEVRERFSRKKRDAK